MFHRFIELLFPRKCVLCRTVLSNSETDLCRNCRIHAPEYTNAKNSISFVAGWTTVWYYKSTVRNSLLRYKFYNNRHYAAAYGRLLAMRILSDIPSDIDILTWVPISRKKKFRRGYDQVQLLAEEVGKQLGMQPIPLIKKIKNTKTQSTIREQAARRANVLGVYQVKSPEMVRNKKILLLDDIITTGATISECAKTLMLSGAENVYCATIAASNNKK